MLSRNINKKLMALITFSSMAVPMWISFLTTLILIMVIARKDLGIGIFVGAVFLGLLTQINFLEAFSIVFLSWNNLIIGLSVTLIPILGGVMDRSKLMEELIQNLNAPKKVSMAAVPAIFGLLPIPGGALMSAPIVDKIDPDLSPANKVITNVWYRELIIFLYPLSAEFIFIATASRMNRYSLILIFIIPCIILALIGYFTLIKEVSKDNENHPRNLKIVLHHIIPVLVAPLVDIIGSIWEVPVIPDIFLFIGLSLSILLAIKFGKKPIQEYLSIPKKMKIWRFPIIIYALYLFRQVFILSQMGNYIAGFDLSLPLFIILGFVLAYATGRASLPISILMPIYFVQFGLEQVVIIEFILIYVSVFMGYIITPIHPCVAYSMEFFHVKYGKVIKKALLPVGISLGLVFITYGGYALIQAFF